MSDNSKENSINHGMTLNDMLGEGKNIEIPIIQRDYAQGRKNAKEIRTDFLKDIFSTLEENRQMKLSFVYGTENNGVYIPYDGQQRLTLMYLVTLFLAAYCEEWKTITELSRFKYCTRDYATDFCRFLTTFGTEYEEGQRNVFQRIDIRDDKINIKEKLKEDALFRNSWSYEPTVCSMLEVLKSIQDEFMKTTRECNFEERIVKAKNYLDEIENGRNIFFDWCPIQASDNIYIKMNGRGKPLSAFDNFKNTLYSELNKFRRNAVSSEDENNLNVLKDFENKMDGDWTRKLFWKYRKQLCGENNHDIAPCMMNFLFFAFDLRHCIEYNPKQYNSFILGGENAFTWIDEKNVVSFLFEFKRLCTGDSTERKDRIDVDDFIWVSRLLDIVCCRLNDSQIDINLPFDNEEGWICKDEIQLLKGISNRGEGDDSWKYMFIGSLYYLYLMECYRFDESSGRLISVDCSCRAQWLELIRRLVKTASLFKARYQDLVIYKHCPYGFSTIFVNTVFNNNKEGNISLAADDFDESREENLRGYFNTSHVYSQLIEEIEKEKLKNSSSEWKTLIEKAESSLPTLNNMIYFLIELSRREGAPDIEEFRKYLEVAKKIIKIDADHFEITEQNLFSSIMLSHADYRIKKGESRSTAESLCSNNSSANDYGWKKFFDVLDNSNEEKERRIEVIRYAFDLIAEKGSVRDAYDSISVNPDIPSWRRIIIKYPELLDITGERPQEAKNRIIAQDKGDWYLITSNVTKRVDPRSEGLDIDLYGMYREALDRKQITQEESSLQCLPRKDACKITDRNRADWYIQKCDDNYSVVNGEHAQEIPSTGVVDCIITHLDQV